MTLLGASIVDSDREEAIGHYWFSVLPRVGEFVALDGGEWLVTKIEHWPTFGTAEAPIGRPPEVQVRVLVRELKANISPRTREDVGA